MLLYFLFYWNSASLAKVMVVWILVSEHGPLILSFACFPIEKHVKYISMGYI